MTTTTPTVRPGQLWEEVSSKHVRRLRVSEVTGEHAKCLSWYETGPKSGPESRMTRISLARFGTGYRLVEDVETSNA